MKNLYETLDIPKTASTAEVHAAYRRRAKKSHPDAGGSREEFEAVNKAREILVDPRRRAQYDRTGAIDESVDNEASEILQMVVAAIDQHLQQFEITGRDPLKHDFIKMARDTLDENVKAAERDVKNFRKAVEVVSKVAKKIRPAKDGGENRLRPIFERRVFDLELRVSQTEDRIRKLKAAWDILKAHKFEVEPSASSNPPNYSGFINTRNF